MFSRSIDRVPSHTAPLVNDRIRRRMEERVAYLAKHPERIPERLKQLEREWDVERTLETFSAALTLFGLVRGVASRRPRWFLLPLAVQGFFLQHALQGWCPPLPLLRRMGTRTQSEIDEERHILTTLEHSGAPKSAGKKGAPSR